MKLIAVWMKESEIWLQNMIIKILTERKREREGGGIGFDVIYIYIKVYNCQCSRNSNRILRSFK